MDLYIHKSPAADVVNVKHEKQISQIDVFGGEDTDEPLQVQDLKGSRTRPVVSSMSTALSG